MEIKPWPYQKEIVEETIKELKTNNRIVIGLPCSGGKTIIARLLIEHFLKDNKKIAFIVNRVELIRQTWRMFGYANISILKAGYEKHYNFSKPIQIIMLQTWRARKDKIHIPKMDYIIIDEFHEGTESGKTFESFFEHFNESKIIGLTATPITAGGYKMNNYDVLIDPYRTRDLQSLGFLVKDKWYSSSQNLELDNLKIQNGDYIESELSKLMSGEKIIFNVVDNFKKHARDKKTIVFACTIFHAEKLNEEFKSNGFKSEVLHSKLEKLNKIRHQILDRFKTGETQIIVNVGILTTGFDETSVECIVFARPTKSLRLYIQMAGRSLRLHNPLNEILNKYKNNLQYIHKPL